MAVARQFFLRMRSAADLWSVVDYRTGCMRRHRACYHREHVTERFTVWAAIDELQRRGELPTCDDLQVAWEWLQVYAPQRIDGPLQAAWTFGELWALYLREHAKQGAR